jgi:hypothetical protein
VRRGQQAGDGVARVDRHELAAVVVGCVEEMASRTGSGCSASRAMPAPTGREIAIRRGDRPSPSGGDGRAGIDTAEVLQGCPSP